MMHEGALAGKTVLVTGGTGTFGRAFVEKILTIPTVKKIIVFSRDELKQYQMQHELPSGEKRVRFFLGDVRDLQRLERALEGVDIVVHAAALKQVPLLEYNPLEAVKTNITGTQNVIDAALDANVEKVLFVSSDKAVQPVNLYGATKLCAERLMIAANAYRGTTRRAQFSVIRYGNVWGSRGSFAEIIRRQRPTGVITITDTRMTRFFISVDRVMDIVGEVIGKMRGGEIFVPKMASFKIADVIKTVAPECEVRTIGVRPGEKLHEVLITPYEAPRAKDAGKMYVIPPEFDWLRVDWLDALPSFSKRGLYASDNPEFLRSGDRLGEFTEI